jgi:hypothetical protein
MKFISEILDAAHNPEGMEELYQNSRQANEEAEFRLDLLEVFEKDPENILLSAWSSRLARIPLVKYKRTINWALAVILGIITGLVLWMISDPQLTFQNGMPYLLLLWAPIAAIPCIIFLTVVSKRNNVYAAIACFGLILASVYILLIYPGMQEFPSKDYLILMIFQLPLLCWIGIGISVMAFKAHETDRFAFLIKSIEVMITAGVYLIFGIAFGAITLGMFAALNITPSDSITRLVAAGGFGLIPIMAVATIYDPSVSPGEQDFTQGLSKFIHTMVRLLLPLCLLVLVIYICVIPFNFMAPFENRNLLIIYNLMQFAIIGLLIGATPLKVDDLSEKFQTWLRRGIIAVSVLALIISAYALSAVVYRTIMEGITLNRITIIGWNIINIAILYALLATQPRKFGSGWHERIHKVFSKATIAYFFWSIFLIVILPLLFR